MGKKFDAVTKLEGERQGVDSTQLRALAITTVHVKAGKHNLVGNGLKLDDGNIAYGL